MPDIGGAKQVTVIEVNVAVGDTITAESTVVTLESEKASMEVPAPMAGVVKRLLTKVGAQVSEGSPLIELEVSGASASAKTPAAAPASTAPVAKVEASAAEPIQATSAQLLLTSPAVRRLARELDIDLARISGSGEKGRVTKEDVKHYLQGQSGSAGGLNVAAMPRSIFLNGVKWRYNLYRAFKKLVPVCYIVIG